MLLALITLQATAQQKNTDGPRKEKQERTKQFQNLSAEDMATLKTNKMTLHLDLNEKQQKDIQKLNLENAIAMKTKMDVRKASKANGNAQKPSQKDRVKIMNERLDQKVAMKAKMKDILNPEQYEKWESAQMRMASKQKGENREKGDPKRMKKQG